MAGLLLLARRGGGEREQRAGVLPIDRGQAPKGMSRPSPRVPLTPKEGWLSYGRQVLRFRPTRWERQLEITTGEVAMAIGIPV